MKPHQTDPLSLTFGLVFLGIAGWWLAHQVVSLSASATAAVFAGGLIALGLLGMVLAWRSARRSGDPGAAR